MNYLAGIIISIFALITSAYFLDQKASYFYDPVALTMVLGGTLAVIVSTMPNLKLKMIGSIIKNGLSSKHRRGETVNRCIAFTQGTDNSSEKNILIEEKILALGKELISLGLPKNEIEKILTLKIQVHTDATSLVSLWIRSLAKYPPAFGLAGTVLGLIHLMKSLTESSSPAQIGILMAIALLATLYGIVLSNFILAPLGEKIKGALEEEISNAEMTLHCVLLKSEKTNLLIVQENLDQYLLDNKQKVDLISDIKGVISA